MSESKSGQASLLEAEDVHRARPPSARATPSIGLLVTNHENLLFMLGAGLLMPPSGLDGSHYHDTLDAFPGWLPVFVGRDGKTALVPQAAIDESTVEAHGLKAVILEVDLTGMAGPVQAFGENGWCPRRLEDGVDSTEELLLVPAPLPVNRIKRILCRASDERDVRSAAEDYSNVPLATFQMTPMKRQFARFTSLAWPPQDGPSRRSVALAAAQAAGGVMAVLQQMANAGELSIHACRAAFDPMASPPADPILQRIPSWVQRGAATAFAEPPDIERDLFWNAVQDVVDQQSSSRRHSAADALVDSFRNAAEDMEPNARRRAVGLLDTLDALGGGLGGDTVSQMLAEHGKPISRAAILFLLRRKSMELLELIDDYPQLDQRARLAAGIFFGVRDGWLGMPLAMRAIPEQGGRPADRAFSDAVTHRMAALAHRLDASDLDIGEPPARVLPLRELFGEPSDWGRQEKAAAVRFAERKGWNCVRTTVSFRRGTYEFRIERGAMHIDFDGKPDIDTGVEPKAFDELLARHRFDPRIEADVHRTLGR